MSSFCGLQQDGCGLPAGFTNQCEHGTACRGLNQLIQPEWVRMFNEEELQMLISGGDQGLDIEDMRSNVHYSGGYHDVSMAHHKTGLDWVGPAVS